MKDIPTSVGVAKLDPKEKEPCEGPPKALVSPAADDGDESPNENPPVLGPPKEGREGTSKVRREKTGFTWPRRGKQCRMYAG